MVSAILSAPKKVLLVKGVGNGDSKLTAFDSALVNAGIGDISLIRVTSILPPAVEFIPAFNFPTGCSIPAIYSVYTSENNTRIISASIGYARTENGPVLVAESAGETPVDIQQARVRSHLDKMLDARCRHPSRPYFIDGIEATVTNITCVFTGIIYVE